MTHHMSLTFLKTTITVAVFNIALLSVTAHPALADTVRFGVHPGYGRMAFDWDVPVRYSASIVGNALVVQFERPVTTDVSRAVRVLTPYVAAVRVEDGGRMLYFTLLPNVTMKSFTLRNVVVVDMSTTPGFGEPRMAAVPQPPLAEPAPFIAKPAPPAVVTMRDVIVASPPGCSERVPMADLVGPGTPPPMNTPEPAEPAPAPRTASAWYIKPRAEIGMAYYETKLADVAIPEPFNYTSGNVTYVTYVNSNPEMAGDYLTSRGFPKRSYQEGTLGLTVGWDSWYGDIYWRNALTNHNQVALSTMSLRNEAFYPEGSDFAAQRNDYVFAASAHNTFHRNQFAATVGRTFFDDWSVNVGYRYSKMKSTTASATSRVTTTTNYPQKSVTGTQITGPANDGVGLTHTTGHDDIETALTTQGPTIGLGYSRALGLDRRHILSIGVGSAFSFAKLEQTVTSGPSTTTGFAPDGSPVFSTLALLPALAVNGKPKAFGVWGNVGYQFYVTPNFALSLAGEGYRFGYGRVSNSADVPIGKLHELSFSGRFGVSYQY